MVKFLWKSEEDREHQWTFAKEKLIHNGSLMSDGSKLRRKDYPDSLTHSFMIMDGQIIALSEKGVFLGEGRFAHAKLAENEAGHLYALKIITDLSESDSSVESIVAQDLGVAGQRVIRDSISPRAPENEKHYIAYQYLGTCLYDYILNNQPLSLDKCYDLSIKISLALYDLHSGEKTKSGEAYVHGDISLMNLVIDEREEIHFIDFGRSRRGAGAREDIIQMLRAFFTPMNERNGRYYGFFNDWMGEYQIQYRKPDFAFDLDAFLENPRAYRKQQIKYKMFPQTIYIFSDNKIDDQAISELYYMTFASQSPSVLQLSDLEINPIVLRKIDSHWAHRVSENELKRIVDKVREITDAAGCTISIKQRKELLFNLLAAPASFYNYDTPCPSALDIAEILTLCRVDLEHYHSMIQQYSSELRLEIVHALNEHNTSLHAIYDQNPQDIENIKQQIITCLFEVSESTITERIGFVLEKIGRSNRPSLLDVGFFENQKAATMSVDSNPEKKEDAKSMSSANPLK